MSCARRLGCTALLFWKERMLRADNTTVIVLALQEHGGPPIAMHRDEIVVDMSTGIDHVPYPGTPYNTCEVPKVGAVALVKCSSCSCFIRKGHTANSLVCLVLTVLSFI